MTDEPNIIRSPLTQEIVSGDKSIQVEIFRLDSESSWTLEVVDEYNNSTVWDDPFETDQAALIAVKETIKADGKGNNSWK